MTVVWALTRLGRSAALAAIGEATGGAGAVAGRAAALSVERAGSHRHQLLIK
jgi:hypothetical protein